MKKLILISILGLTACGETVTTSGFDPNQADVTSAEVDGKMMVTGRAGSSFTETEIDDFIIVPECQSHDMGVESKNVVTNPDGTITITAICA